MDTDCTGRCKSNHHMITVFGWYVCNFNVADVNTWNILIYFRLLYHKKNAKNGYKSSQNTQKVRPRLNKGKMFMLWTTINTVMIFITITLNYFRGRRRVVLFTKIYAISACHHPIWEFDPTCGELEIILSKKLICQLLEAYL